jgi:hypothetical protein
MARRLLRGSLARPAVGSTDGGPPRPADAVLELHAVTDDSSLNRARSRSAPDVGSGTQMAGTRSRRPSSASTHASMRSVLQASGASPLTFCASAILDPPAELLELTMHEARAVHRLDRRPDRRQRRKPLDQPAQAVGVRRRHILQHAAAGDINNTSSAQR